MSSPSRLLLLALACAAACAVAAASSSAAAAGAKYVLLVFTEACYARFLSGDFLHWGCLRLTASRAIGVAIITGACVVKVPQIAAFVAAGSAAGCSLGAAYAELAGYALTLIFHVTNGSPWTAYGEAVVVAAQAAAVVGIMWAYAWPGVPHAALAAAAGAALVQAALAAARGGTYLAAVQAGATLLFMGARLVQIVDNVRAGSTGTQALLTLVMNFGGSAARIFTAAVEVRDRPEVLLSFVISTLLNGVLLAQYAYYYGKAPARAAAAAAAVAGDKAAKAAGKRKAA